MARSENPQLKKWQRSVIILLILLLVCMVLAILGLVRQKNLYTHNFALKGELDTLMLQHKEIKSKNAEFSSQMAGRDSLIRIQTEEINKLIGSQADYRKIQKKLTLLRRITQDYVKRIDSLIIINEELTAENLEIKKEIGAEREKNKSLSRDKAQLNERMQDAAIFKAYNLRATGVRSKGREEQATDRAARADRISITFTIGENRLIPAGPRTVYVRIARPDNVVLCEGTGDDYAFDTPDGKLQYSLKTDIHYAHNAQDLRLAWVKRDQSATAMRGTYHVIIYIEGKEIGRSSFILR